LAVLDLLPRHLGLLVDTLKKNVPHAEVWAYGSRANHLAHESSDLDLVIRNPGQLEVPQKNLHKLRDALAESPLPIIVEVFDWARLPETFRSEIQRQPVVKLAEPGKETLGSPWDGTQ
jgi:predicted nucleotidyltransferase